VAAVRQVVVEEQRPRRSVGSTAWPRDCCCAGADVFFSHWRAYDRNQPYGDDPEGPDALTKELEAAGVRAGSAEVDFIDPDAAEQVMDRVEESLGPPSILVNNAVHSVKTDAMSLDAASLDAHYAVNVRALALLSTEFARRFQGGKGGRIINFTSGQGATPMPQTLAYATTKGAVEAFTTSLAAGVAHLGITVNAIDPGGTDTGWMPDQLKVAILENSAFGRIGQLDDAARLVTFLASEAGTWITGQVIRSRGA
jgi:3-oxoacyl-[acyl-carrier protein] reductase